MTPSERYKKIIDNVRVMVDKGAPNEDLLTYLSYEGLTGEQFASLLKGPTVAGQAKEFLKGLPTGAIGLLETAATGAAAILPEDAEQAVRGTVGEVAAAARRPFQAAPGYEDTIPRKFGEATGSILPFLPLGAAGALGRVGALGLGAGAGAGEARVRAEEEGGMGQRGAATGLGAVVGLTEALPVFAFLDRLSTPIKDGIFSYVRRAAVAGGQEGAQEAAASVAQDLIAKGLYKPEQVIGEQALEEGAYGAGVGALVQGILDMSLGRRAKAPTAETPVGLPPEAKQAPLFTPEEAPTALTPDESAYAQRQELMMDEGRRQQALVDADSLRSEFDTLQRENERLKTTFDAATTDEEKAAIKEQADRIAPALDSLQKEIKKVESKLPAEERGRAQAAPEQMGLDFEMPLMDRQRTPEGVVLGEQPAPPTELTQEQRTFFDESNIQGIRDRLVAGEMVTPAEMEQVRLAGVAKAQAIEAAPTPDLTLPEQRPEARPPFALRRTDIEQPGAAPREPITVTPEGEAIIDRPEVEERRVVEDDFKAMGIGSTNKKLRAQLLGKDLADPEQRAQVKGALEDYANDPNRSEKLRTGVENFLSRPMFMEQLPLDLQERAADERGRTRKEPSEPVDETGAPGVPPSVPPGDEGGALGTEAPVAAGVDESGLRPGGINVGEGAQQRPMRREFIDSARRTYNRLRDEGSPSWKDLSFGQQLEFMDAFEQVKGVPRYRRASAGTQGMSVDNVRKLVNRITAKWKKPPDIFVVQSVNDLADYGLENIDPSAKGVFEPGTQSVFLIADNITDYSDAVITVAHESIGHFGLQSVLGDTYKQTMNRLYQNPDVKKAADIKLASDPTLTKEIAVEEVIAEAVEKKVAPQSGLGRALATLRNLLRNFFNRLTAKVPNSEIDALIAQSANYVIAGTVQVDKAITNTDAFKDWFGDSVIRNPDGSPKIMYHGTAADITEFKPKQAGAIFVTDDPEFADSFTLYSEEYLTARDEEAGRNIMPLYVRAEKPFDYENRAHVDALMSRFSGADRSAIEKGMWSAIEDPRAQQAIKDLGFDSFYAMENGRKNLAVYDPNQVKSAIGNEGTFRRDTGDIRYRKAPTQLTAQGEAAAKLFEQIKGISNPKPKSADETLIKRLKGMIPSKDAISWETKIRRQLVDKEAPIAEQLRTKFNNAVKDELTNTVNPKLLLAQKQDIANFGDKVVEIGGIRIGKDGLIEMFERKDAQGKPINMDRVLEIINVDLAKKLGSADLAVDLAHNALIGFRAGEINKFNERMEKQAAAAEVKGNKLAAQKLRDQIINTRVSQEQVNAATEAMKKFPEIRQAYDVFTEFKNGLVDFLETSGRINSETAKNWRENVGYVPWTRVEEKTNEFELDPAPGRGAYINLSKEPHLDKEGSSKEINNIFDNMVGTAFFLTKMGIENHANLSTLKVLPNVKELTDAAQIRDAQKKHADRLMFSYDNGERKAYLLSDPFQLSAFMTIPAVKNGIVMGTFSNAAKLIRTTITHMPAFAISQLIQDGTYRGMLLSGVRNPWAIPPKVFGNFFQLVFSDGSVASNELARMGVTGTYDGMPDNAVRKVKERLGLEHRNAFKRAWDGLEKFSLSADLAVRAAIFDQTLKETGDRALAFYRAKEYINFKRQGVSPVINTLRQSIPFMNAYMQGMDILYRTMTGKGVAAAERKEAMKLFYYTGAQLAVLNLLYAMAVAGDDEYEGLDEFVKNKNYIIPGTGIRIPVAPEVGFFFKVLPEQLYRYVNDEGTQNPQDAKALKERLTDALRDAMGGVGYMPAAIKPALEVSINYSFFLESPIVGAGLRNLDPRLQFTESTSELAKILGGIANISPAKIDYFMRAYTGMAGAMALDLSDAALNPDRMEKPIYKIPQISSFMYDPTGRGLKSNFYKFREDVTEVRDTINMLSREGRMEELEEYLTPEKIQVYALKGVVSKLERQLSDLRKYRKIVAGDEQMSPQERRALTNEILQMERDIVRAYDIPQLRKMAGY